MRRSPSPYGRRAGTASGGWGCHPQPHTPPLPPPAPHPHPTRARARRSNIARAPLAHRTQVQQQLKLQQLVGHAWHVQEACAQTGEGLWEGLDWLAHHFKKI